MDRQTYIDLCAVELSKLCPNSPVLASYLTQRTNNGLAPLSGIQTLDVLNGTTGARSESTLWRTLRLRQFRLAILRLKQNDQGKHEA